MLHSEKYRALVCEERRAVICKENVLSGNFQKMTNKLLNFQRFRKVLVIIFTS